MTKGGIPNFRGWRALIVHRLEENASRLERQLQRLGLTVQIQAPADAASALRRRAAEIVLFDADAGFDGMLPWPAGTAPMPLIALLGSEAPGRLEWMAGQMPDAFLQKPIPSAGIYAALTIAVQSQAARTRLNEELTLLRQKLAARPLVVRAVVRLMETSGMDVDLALSELRRRAMAARHSIEEEAALILASHCSLRRRA